MENQINQEPELEKPSDLMAETPSMQSEEPIEPIKNQNGPDTFKKLQDELAEAKDKYIRLYAEFDNHRRRSIKEKRDTILLANEDLIKSLLPIADDFERAEKSFKERSDKESEGFSLIQNKLKKVLEQYGVKPMEIGSSSNFDADLHEAITQIPTEEHLKGKIVEVIEKGYLLNEKVIRFAKVIIGN